MTLSWEHLSLSEAKGFVTNYTILYYKTAKVRKRLRLNTMSKIVDGSNNSTAIYELNEVSAYLVQISANTAAGNGVLSMPVIVPLPGNFSTILLFSGSFICKYISQK